MRPIASDQSQVDLALDDVLGTKGQVQLLRVLATETNGSFASPEVAARAGLTPSGARKALRRLARAGVVEKVGTGRSTRYVLRREGKLAREIIRLFELERERTDPGWARERARVISADRSGMGPGERTRKEDGNGNASPGSRAELDPLCPEFNGALVGLLEENLSLLRRAREKVLEKLDHREPGNGHDLWEWCKVLDTYPLPRLLNFLESDSPRALRLRKSSPFPEVISDRERKRLDELMERTH